MNKHKIIIISLGILILATIIGIVILNTKENNIDDTLNEDVTQQVEEYIPVYKDEVTESTANLGYVIDKISDNKEDVQLDKLTENTNILDTSDREYNITRFQLATIIYNIIVDENKLSSSTPINITFEDNSDIPTKYFTAVAITSNLGILQYSDKFDGYKYATKKEVDEAFERLQDYLDKWVADAINEEPITNEENTNNIVNNQELESIAEDILKDREPEDKLNGQSVAVTDEPKSIYDIINNWEAIEAFDLYDDQLLSRYTTGEKINFDYINLDEGFLSSNKIESLSVDEDPNYTVADMNIIGATITAPVTMSYNIIDNNLILSNKDILDKISIFNMEPTKCFGIKDYSIVTSGDWYPDELDPLIVLESKSIDCIGIAVSKDILEGENIFSENKSNNYILLVIPLTNSVNT